MISNHFKIELENQIGLKVKSVIPFGGSSFSQTLKLCTTRGDFFIKTGKEPALLSQYTAEKIGLETGAATQTIDFLKVIWCGKIEKNPVIITEFIDENPGLKNKIFWEIFGTQLADLHRHTANQYGFPSDNFIGSLPQSNKRLNSWANFYARERLFPQFKSAYNSGFFSEPDKKAFENFCKALPELFPQESPRLIHGDLWSGNFLVASNGRPVLIDPSVSYSNREMDLAMSRLFGGFSPRFYASYQEVFPLTEDWKKRIPYCQLYYLLVHVNLFGISYREPARIIFKNF